MSAPLLESHALAKPVPSGLALVAEERVILMIAACAKQISAVTSIVDAKEVTTHAEAVAAVTRKVNVAKEVKQAAVRLLIEAESKLGEILLSVPKGFGPNGRKTDFLAKHGIDKRRASLAQRLAAVPQERIEAAITAGAKTLHGVTTRLELHTDGYVLREKRAVAMAYLCVEAVKLLERCVKADKVPHAGTVNEMVTRLRNIGAHGNLKGSS